MAQTSFDILGVDHRFDVDPGKVQSAYFARSASLHPDIAAGDEHAQRQMAMLNAAKAELENPERRASALLAVLGGPGADQEKSLPPAFLMEIMEVREAVEEARGEGDPAEREKTRRHWELWAEDQRRDAIDEMTNMFASLSESPSPDELKAIRIRLNAWRYIERLIEQLDPEYDPQRADFGG